MTEQAKNTAKETAIEKVQATEELQVLQSIAANNTIKKFKNVSSGRGGFISIVKSTNGTRLRISKRVNEELGYPKELFVGFEGDYLLIFNADGLDVSNVKLEKNDKGQINIYNSELVNLIIDEFKLDYTNRTSRSFADGHFKEQGRPVLYVKMV